MATQNIAEAIERVRKPPEHRPHFGRLANAPAVARWERGLRVTVLEA